MAIARAMSAKFKAFSLPVIKSYSVVPVFRYSVVPVFRYSVIPRFPVSRNADMHDANFVPMSTNQSGVIYTQLLRHE